MNWRVLLADWRIGVADVCMLCCAALCCCAVMPLCCAVLCCAVQECTDASSRPG